MGDRMVKRTKILGWDTEFLCPKCGKPTIKVEKRNGNLWWACLDCENRFEAGNFIHPQPDTEWLRQRDYLKEWAKNHQINQRLKSQK
jgi:ribosomal protein L37AE/L43A